MTGEELRQICDDSKLKPQEIYRRAKITRSRYYNILGKVSVTVDDLTRIAKGLDQKPGDLIENSVGAIAPLLPLVEELKKFTPRAHERVREMLRAAALMLEEHLPGDASHQTEVLRAAYNSRPSNSKKTDELAEPMGDYGSSAETANVPTSGGAAPTATAKNRGKSKR